MEQPEEQQISTVDPETSFWADDTIEVTSIKAFAGYLEFRGYEYVESVESGDPQASADARPHPEVSAAHSEQLFDLQAGADDEHYTPAELAQKLKVSTDTILRKFADYPGVIDLGTPEKGRKRRYRVIRIPHSVLEKFLIEMQVT